MTIYHFQTWHAGLASISILIGTFTGIFICDYLSDHIADFFTRRAGGIRHPEHRLSNAIVPALILPAGLLMYGFGVDYSHHWVVPTVALTIGKCQSLKYHHKPELIMRSKLESCGRHRKGCSLCCRRVPSHRRRMCCLCHGFQR
jgi:hypothetical protein